ncbi:MAG: hypothetical protein HOI07_05925 [Betaproteobacteria bacterium]|jgi:hypothetical protein|nr:hypothetical protein [Betaproteobacteria bacterium]
MSTTPEQKNESESEYESESEVETEAEAEAGTEADAETELDDDDVDMDAVLDDDVDAGSVMVELLETALITPDGETICSALVNMGRQLEIQNKILVKLLASFQKN